MTERLMDVLNLRGHTLHTYPISLSESADDAAYEAKAIEAAIFSKLVPPDELSTLTARTHVNRPGQLASYGDALHIDEETAESFSQAVRSHAYLEWEHAGKPEGQADLFWYQACEARRRLRAYSLWETDNRPADRAVEHWQRAQCFEEK